MTISLVIHSSLLTIFLMWPQVNLSGPEADELLYFSIALMSSSLVKEVQSIGSFCQKFHLVDEGQLHKIVQNWRKYEVCSISHLIQYMVIHWTELLQLLRVCIFWPSSLISRGHIFCWQFLWFYCQRIHA